MSNYLCNLVVPGAAKSGTSTLHEALALHPSICMSVHKEPHHFAREDKYRKGPSEHNKLFAQGSAAKYFGESSTGYLPWFPAVQRIKKDLYAPKIIIILRDPIERAFSHYRWRYRLGLEKRNFFDALRADGYGFHPEKPTAFGYMGYIEFSRYSLHCPMWVNSFGRENCLIISLEALKTRFEQTINRCFKFLDLPCMTNLIEVTANATFDQGRRPPRAITRLSSMVPQILKNLRFYSSIKKKVLQSTAPIPPLNMNERELTYLIDHLSEDLQWYKEHV